MPDVIEDVTDVTYAPEDEVTGEYTDTTTTTTTTTTKSTTTVITTTSPPTTQSVTTTKPATTTTKPVTTTTKLVTTTTKPVTTTTQAPVTTTSKLATTTSAAPVTTSSAAPVTVPVTTAVVTDPTEPVTEPTVPALRPVIIDGEFETAFDWDEELADKESAAYKEKRDTLETDLKTILGDDEAIETVELTECTFTEAGVEATAEAETAAEPVAPAVSDIVNEPVAPAVSDIVNDPARRRRQIAEVVNKAHADFKVKVTAKSTEVAQAAATKTITEANPETFPSLSVNSAKTYSQVVTYVDPSVTLSPVTAASSQKLRIAISIMGVLAVLIL